MHKRICAWKREKKHRKGKWGLTPDSLGPLKKEGLAEGDVSPRDSASELQ